MSWQPLTETASSLALGITGVVGTNLENVVVAVAMFCRQTSNPVLAIGFFAGLSAMLVFSWLSGSAMGMLPTQYLGLLGLVPIALGIRELLRTHDGQPEKAIVENQQTAVKSTAVLALLMVANGADTIAVFAPLIAESEATDRVVITVAYLLASALLAWISVQVCTHPRLTGPIQRYGGRIAPFAMIGIGVYILLNTGTDTMP
jgi:cadmium resistance protein CadD (predicted permease)